jgi:DNA-binding transcriptional ArsR family regulator
MVDYRSNEADDWATTTDTRTGPSPIENRRTAVDELLSALSHRRRRDVLYALSESSVTDVESLATAIVAREADLPRERIDVDDRESVLIDLYHNHLPKLADQRVIEYDDRSGAVRWTAPSDELESLLACCRALDGDTE